MPECMYCGTEFAQRRETHKFCGKRCREKHWTTANRVRLNATVRKYRAKRYIMEGRWRDTGPKSASLLRWMAELKDQPCHDCGCRFDACCMDFDHRAGEIKSYNLGTMFSNHYSRELIEAELAKCDLVCANCHRIRTRDRRSGSAMRRNIEVYGKSLAA